MLFNWLETGQDAAQHQLVGTAFCAIVFIYLIANRERIRDTLQRRFTSFKDYCVDFCIDFCVEFQEEYRSRLEEARMERKTDDELLIELLGRKLKSIRDKELFKQPESSHMGDCPICCIPLSLDLSKSVLSDCCSKIICDGCDYANYWKREKKQKISSCPFCRELTPDTDEGYDKQRMKRVEANDPVAISREGEKQYGKGEYKKAFEYWTRAAALGHAEGHYKLATLYSKGEGVEKDGGKATHHLEEAVIGGHPQARYLLGNEEWENGNYERALKHYIIGAKQGEEDAPKMLMVAFKDGKISKEDFTATLRAHQAAVDETKSPMREEAEEYRRKQEERGS